MSRRNLTWFMVGFMSSTAVGLVLRAAPAHAQSNTRTQISPLNARQAVTPRRTPVPAPTQDDDDSQPTPTRTIVRTPVDGAAPDDTAGQDGDDPDSPAPAQRSNGDGQRADGMERPLQQDGMLPVGEDKNRSQDGEPIQAGDARLRSDIDAFENPPAGYDALAFQVEAPDPILDRRPSRLARFEPYDPIGIRKGSWVIFPEIEFGMGATSNVFRAPAKASSTFFEVTPTVRAVTDWRTHAIELRATGLASAYPGFSTENDRAYTFEARGRYDVSKRTSVEVFGGHSKAQDQRQSREFNDSASTRPDILTNQAAVAINHRINRLSIQLRGSYIDLDYENVAAVSGTIIDNSARDVVSRETAVRATWEFKPTLFAFAETSLNDRHYRIAPTDGITRDSHGHRMLVGLGFGNNGGKWRGEAAVGYGQQTPNDERVSSGIDALLVEANLAYRPTALTSFLATARTSLEDSTTIGQSGSVVRNFGLEARHAFRRHLIGIAGVRYNVTDYSGVDLKETETIGELGFEYFVNRNAIITGRYDHAIFDSTTANANYTVDTVRLGFRLRQ